MWSSNSLPRQRPIDPPPPPPPHKKATTLLRNSSKAVDVIKLKNDIKTLSHQLDIVRARLESAINEKEHEQEQEQDQENDNNLMRRDSIDSRLSTALFSNGSRASYNETPHPQPEQINDEDVVSHRLNRSVSQSVTHLVQPSQQLHENKRFSMCFPSSSSNFIPIMKRSETFSKVDLITKELQERIGKMKRTESLSIRPDHPQPPLNPPPKPQRKYIENFETLPIQNSYISNIASTQSPSSSFMSSSVAFLSMCNHREFVDAINKRFTQGQCWFSRGGQLYFVNPYNNVTSQRCDNYSVIPTITSSLLEEKSSALFLRGLSGSGKSYIAELVCKDIVKRFDSNGHISSLFKTATDLLRPFISANNSYNAQCSKIALHYFFQTKENRLTKINFRHFPIESMSRGCRANIFAIVANDLKENEKDDLKISGFRLRENGYNYGNIEQIRKGLNKFKINVKDVLKILAACILLNNLNFKVQQNRFDIDNLTDLEDASSLLGISAIGLYRYIISDADMDSRLIRDNFVTAIYTRMIQMIIGKINLMLDSFPDFFDGTSVVTDSGVSVGTNHDNSNIIHIVDIPGYVRSNQNSLNELLVNAINDIIQHTDSDLIQQFLKDVDNATQIGENWNNREYKKINHCADFFEVNYDLRLLVERNFNIVPRKLINLFDHRSCTFQFATALFAIDIENMIISENFFPSSINWPHPGKSVIQNVLESVRKLRKEIGGTNTQQIICLKSNESLEYARVHENGLGYQLNLYRTIVANLSKLKKISVNEDQVTKSRPKLPASRSYEIRDGRKHYFPQRRNIIVDYQDPTNCVSLRAGEIVKVIGFSDECYIIETCQRTRATIPILFTEKCCFIQSK